MQHSDNQLANCNIMEILLFVIDDFVHEPHSRSLAKEGIKRNPLAFPKKLCKFPSNSPGNTSPYYSPDKAPHSSSPSLCRSQSQSWKSDSPLASSHRVQRNYKSNFSFTSSGSGASPIRQLSGASVQSSASSCDIPDKIPISEPTSEHHEEHAMIEGTASFSVDSEKAQDQLYRAFVPLCKKVEEFILNHPEINIQENVIPYLKYLPLKLKKELESTDFSRHRRDLPSLKRDNLMDFLGPFWDELHPNLLIHVVKLLNSEDLTKEALLYGEQVARYGKNFKIRDVPRKFEGKDYPGGQTIVFQLSNCEAELSISHFTNDLTSDFQSATNCDGPPRVKKIRLGSIYLIIVIPSPLEKEVFFQKAVQEFLEKYKVEAVSINEECVYKVYLVLYLAIVEPLNGYIETRYLSIIQWRSDWSGWSGFNRTTF